MKFHHALNWALLSYFTHVTAFIISAGAAHAVPGSTVPTLTASDVTRNSVTGASSLIASAVVPQVPLSAAITAAPTIITSFVRRQTQKCFNDQGFQVDCATWTGYYYSWGPPGNPYEGGPGEGQYGSGSGSGGNNNLVFQSSANCFERISLSMIAGVCFLAIALFL